MIKLDDIPKDEIFQALNDFSEGSEGLKRCLSVMWKNNLRTIACCAGDEDSFDEAYIMMDENIDMFSYLSDELLFSDMVEISFKNNSQVIAFIGPSSYKEKLFNILANDIMSGKKKSNLQSLRNKIDKPFPREWQINGIVYHMMKDLIPSAGPIKKIIIILLCKALNNSSTLEQQKPIIEKCYRELALAQEKKESGKHR